MIVYFRDYMGIAMIKVDEDGIDIVDGDAYFSCPEDDRDFIIPVEYIVAIKENK